MLSGPTFRVSVSGTRVPAGSLVAILIGIIIGVTVAGPA